MVRVFSQVLAIEIFKDSKFNMAMANLWSHKVKSYIERSNNLGRVIGYEIVR
jgi:hypothetical protein